VVSVIEKVQVVEKLPKGWKWVRLEDVCDQDRQTINPNTPLSASLPYLSLEHIESNTGRILREPSESLEDEGLSNTFSFNSQHVLYGKLRPYLNKVALPNFSGRCTTEAIPLLPKRDVEREYLAWVLRRQETIDAAMRGKTGSRMPRANITELLSLKIPLPPLPEQKRIVGILSDRLTAIDKARTATEAQLKAAKALPAAYLRQVFDSPEAQKWKRKKFGDVARIVASQVDPKIPEYGVLPHVNGENIESGTGRLTYLNTAEEEGMTSGKYMFDPGDVLYSKLRPYLRKVVLVDFQGLCSADMYPIKFDPQWLDSEFSVWLLLSDKFTSYANEASARARMPKLNREQLFEWEALIPPLKKQQEIAAFINQQSQATNTLVDALQSQLTTINQLPAATLRQAFNGEL